MFATAEPGDQSACGVSAADGATATVTSEATAEVFFSIRADPAATSAGGGGTTSFLTSATAERASSREPSEATGATAVRAGSVSAGVRVLAAASAATGGTAGRAVMPAARAPFRSRAESAGAGGAALRGGFGKSQA